MLRCTLGDDTEGHLADPTPAVARLTQRSVRGPALPGGT